MVRLLLAAAIGWPLLLAGSWWGQVSGSPAAWPSLVYLAASRVCHQRPERSFHTKGVQWPVCGRCAALYGGAALAALGWPLWGRRRRAERLPRPPALEAATLRRALVIAAVPTAVTIIAEWAGLPMSTMVRTMAALPFGAALFVVIISALAPVAQRPIG